jgi:uncharacterized protein (TIGR02996 family)
MDGASVSAADEDELLAEAVGVLEELVAEKHLELASRCSVTSLAELPLLQALADPDVSVSDWLVDQSEVAELYLDEEELRHRFRGVLARMRGDATPSRHHPELAAAIVAAPDDEQAWSVYADWLEEQGDPRGELMSLQLRRGAKKQDKQEGLEARETALLARHRRHFFGDLPVDAGADDRVRVTFRRGFFDEARLSHPVDLKSLLELESSRFLRTLVARCYEVAQVAEILGERPLPATLRHLEIGVPIERYAPERGRIDLGVATRGLRHLERLAVRCHEIALSSLETPALRELEIGARQLELHAQGFASLRGLELLDIQAEDISGTEVLSALFEAPPPRLHALTIRNVRGAPTVHQLLPALLGSPLAGMLRSLDLSESLLADDDARALLAAKKKLARLETLDVKSNGFSRALREELAATWPASSVARALTYDPDHDDEAAAEAAAAAGAGPDDDEDDEDDERYEEVAE